MSKAPVVQARFLLGPACGGKTFRCLAEIRAELLKSPEGRPLILLAPKQATFQLERQLLAGPAETALQGYTRLRILSFERSARFVLETLSVAPPKLLSEEGRVMVLRALLMQRKGDLKLFDKSARSPGFAQELSALLAELQSHQFSPEKLRKLSQLPALPRDLHAKLHDLALLLEAYAGWLAEYQLQDASRLLDAATNALRESSEFRVPGSKLSRRGARGEGRGVMEAEPMSGDGPLAIDGLWLDGFAEMTPQEMDLLTALAQCCRRVTLAFCLDAEPIAPAPWLSIWSVVARTFSECRLRLASLPGARVSVEILARDCTRNRFAGNPILQHLETNWAQGAEFTNRDLRFTSSAAAGDRTQLAPPIRLVACANPESEAVLAAREIRRFVRGGGRYREAAVLVRSMEAYHKSLARTFERFEIPFFLDRREAVTHHPLAELTRSALRLAAFDWRQADWFAALKTGLMPLRKHKTAEEMETGIDRLENEALAHGWQGAKWLQPIQLAENSSLAQSLERLRQRLVPPFQELTAELGQRRNQPTGAQLAEAVREFWRQLEVERTLEGWSAPEAELPARELTAIHQTVWEQMNAWLDNVALAFPGLALSLREWLPILEAGLANLTVGVIPPALDQVLIGAIDRSRNPDLKLALVLGMNEAVFPATPAQTPILSEADRNELRTREATLGPDLRDQLARERYYGYIAVTRARERLVVAYSRQDAAGKALNPSPFVSHLRALFPNLEVENFHGEADWREAEHVSELAAPLVAIGDTGIKAQAAAELLRLPAVAALRTSLRELRNPDPAERLSPERAARLHGPVLHTSVSRLEQFAACPFRFFVHSGLHAEERQLFEYDARERGSFQHEVLKQFHDELTQEGKRWREVTPVEARERVGRIAAALSASYHEGLLQATGQSQFAARMLTAALQDFVETIIGWMHTQYDFDPAHVELAFGGKGPYPAWELELDKGQRLALQGRIDRVDLFREPDSEDAWCVVIDYKSAQRRPDPVLMAHGVQLQLPAYLGVLRHWPDPRAPFRAARLVPAGVFYVGLRGQAERCESRAEALAEVEAARRLAYRHTGRFDVSALRKLDHRPDARQGDQFNYRLKNDGSLWGKSAEALERPQFEAVLDSAETQLREMGRAILSGWAEVDPYRKGKTLACDQCYYRAICRIDPWTHHYRVLRTAEAEAGAAAE